MLQSLRRRAPALVVCASLSAVMLAGCGDSSSDDAADTPETSASAPDQGSGTQPATRLELPPVTSTTSAGGRTIEVAFAGGQVQGGRRTEKVELGEEVRIRAVSDVAEELHVHTYDRRVDLQPGQPGEVVFTADIPGRHEVEFEKSGRAALTLEVA
jgi:hypothetical protein